MTCMPPQSSHQPPSWRLDDDGNEKESRFILIYGCQENKAEEIHKAICSCSCAAVSPSTLKQVNLIVSINMSVKKTYEGAAGELRDKMILLYDPSIKYSSTRKRHQERMKNDHLGEKEGKKKKEKKTEVDGKDTSRS